MAPSTVRAVAIYLNVDAKTVNPAQRGDLPALGGASSGRFRGTNIDAWIERQKVRTSRPKRKANDR